jgi:hypothetical protein
LWLAVREVVVVGAVFFKNVDYSAEHAIGFSKLIGVDEFKVVGRSVVLGEVAVASPHVRTDGQTKTRGIELAFVVSIRKEIDDLRRLSGMCQQMGYDTVDFRVGDKASFISEASRVSPMRRVRLNAGPLKLKPCGIKHFRTN